jgi:hypothetical protein
LARDLGRVAVAAVPAGAGVRRGLALTLTAAGFAVVRLGKLAGRVKVRRVGRLLALVHRVAPVGTAVVVFALGCGLVLRGAAATLG